MYCLLKYMVTVQKLLSSITHPKSISNDWVSEWVSDWLLFNANWAIFQPYHGENKFTFRWDDDDDVSIVLDQHTEVFFIVLANWNNNLWVDMSLHLELSQFLVNNVLLFLINAACLVEKYEINVHLNMEIDKYAKKFYRDQT